MKKTLKIMLSLVACLLAIAVLGCGCAKKNNEKKAYAEEASMAYYADYDMPMAAPMEGMGMDSGAVDYASVQTTAEQNRTAEAGAYSKKIIYNANLSLRADDPIEVGHKAQQACLDVGGYVGSSYEKTKSSGAKYVSLTLKVPSDKLNTFIESVSGLAKVESSNLDSNDITDSYYDVKARLETQKAEEAQLLKLLESCETVEEMLLVREQLVQVRETIESYQATINLWDNRVDFATVEITIEETVKTAPEIEDDEVQLWKFSDVLSKISSGFTNGCKVALNIVYGIGIGLANAIIPIIIIGGIGVGIFFLIRAIVRKSKAKRALKKSLGKTKEKKEQPEKKARVSEKEEKAEE